METTNSDQPQSYPSLAAWKEEGDRRFGPDRLQYRFTCPSCGYVATVKQWVDLGVKGAIAFSCIGRWTGSNQEMHSKEGGPCNYSGGGLFNLNPIKIVEINSNVFAYADPTQAIPENHDLAGRSNPIRQHTKGDN